MRFEEFVNKNQNVINDGARRKITSAIPISEDRNKFFMGELFQKYDNVTSDGVTYRILEQCSNYYTVVDATGNIHRKFAKQLTPTLVGNVNSDDSFHGYMMESNRARELLEENYDAIIDKTVDDVGLLKQLKEADKADKMDTSYKIRDKLTIAKIIADAIGIPHDVVSSPENLVNQAIRKAAKDPAMLRNKEILQNMLKIAAEVGIRFSSSVFDKVEESTELDELSSATLNSYLTKSKIRATAAYEDGKRADAAAAAEVKPKPRIGPTLAAILNRKRVVKESENLDEAALNAWKNRMKTSGATHFKSDPAPVGSTASLLHAYKKDGEKKIKVGSFDQTTQRGVKESEELDDGVNEDRTRGYAHHHAMYLKYIAKGDGANAERHAAIRDSLKESEELEELDISTVKSYADKAKKSRPGTPEKAIKRFAGSERAVDRIHRDELKKIGTVKEDDMLTYAALRKKLVGDLGPGGETDPKKKDNEDKGEFTHGHSMHPTSGANRKQLINKLKGD